MTAAPNPDCCGTCHWWDRVEWTDQGWCRSPLKLRKTKRTCESEGVGCHGFARKEVKKP